MNLDLIALRQELHAIPEPAFKEFETRDLLLKYLRGFPGLEIRQFANSTGILAVYHGGDGPYRLFRADMDALPMNEATGCSFSSRNPGMMHACGHDLHMAILMGLIDRVQASRPERNLLFLFQPAEEGQGGAQAIIAEGLIQSYQVESVYALHVASGMEVGTVSSRPGVFFGIPQEFDVTFKGVSSHAAFPEKGVNALAAGIEFIRLMEREMASLCGDEKCICHIGKMAGGTVRNVVADLCRLEGTQRSLSKGIHARINELILANASAAAGMFGAEYQVDFLGTYDPVVNAPVLVEALAETCLSLGYDFSEAEAALTGEDFGFFTSLYPGLLYWLGSGCHHPLHSDLFLPDPDCIGNGVEIMNALAVR